MARSDDLRNQAQSKQREAESASLKMQEFDEIIRKATQDREVYQQQHNNLIDEIARLNASAEQEAENERQEEERRRLQTAAAVVAATNSDPRDNQ